MRKTKTLLVGALLMLACSGAALAVNVYTIYPVPQEQAAVEGTAKFTATVNVVAEDGIDQATKDRVAQVLADKGLAAEFAAKASSKAANVFIGVNGSGGAADKKASDLGLKRDVFSVNRYDRHIVSLTQAKGLAQVVVLGENTNAAFFGLASLEQMLDRGTEGLPCVAIYDYADVKDRGVIEGYYGIPYSVAVTKDLFRFMMRYKMNSYMYGAKSDPYHSQYWDKDYPTTITAEQEALGYLTKDMMGELTEVSHQTKVNFIWAIHPGGEFTGSNDNVITRIMNKFELMHKLGVRQFAVFVDDVGVPTDAPTLALNAKRLTDLQNKMDAKWNAAGVPAADTLKPLHFVPQLYAFNWQGVENRKSFYTALANSVPKTQVYITGGNVWSVPNVSDLDAVKNEYGFGRDLAWWWNYPCNDNADAQVFINDMYKNFYDMPEINSGSRLPKDLNGCVTLLSNPMQQGEAAKVPLFSIADYAWNNSEFDNETSWKAATEAVAGKEKAEDLQIVAKYLSWNDPQTLINAINKYKGQKSSTDIDTEISRAAAACQAIIDMKDSQSESDRLFYADLKPWLAKLSSMLSITKGLVEIDRQAKGADGRFEAFAKLLPQIEALENSQEFIVDALEGMGNEIGIAHYNAKLCQGNLVPFIKYLKEKIEKEVVNTTESATKPSAVTTAGGRLSSSYSATTLTGYLISTVVMAPGDIAGVQLPQANKLASIALADSVPADLALKVSADGKEWTTLERPAKAPETAVKFIVLQNTSEATKPFRFGSKVFSYKLEEKTTAASSSMPSGGLYQDRGAKLFIDGDYSTWACLNRNQQSEDAYTVTLKKAVPVHDVRICMGTTNGDYMQAGKVQVSEDGSKWTDLFIKGTKTKNYTMQAKQVVKYSNEMSYCDFDGEGRTAKYVRLLNTTPNTAKWLRLYEIEVNAQYDKGVAPSPATLEDGTSLPELSDGNGGTYPAMPKDGALFYSLQSMHQAGSVTIYSEPKETPAEVFATDDGETWEKVGEVSGYVQAIDLSAMPGARAVKMVWKGEAPAVYEIVADFREDLPMVITGIGGAVGTESTEAFFNNGSLHFGSGVASARVYAADGTLLWAGKADCGGANTPVKRGSVVIVETMSGSGAVKRTKAIAN